MIRVKSILADSLTDLALTATAQFMDPTILRDIHFLDEGEDDEKTSYFNHYIRDNIEFDAPSFPSRGER